MNSFWIQRLNVVTQTSVLKTNMHSVKCHAFCLYHQYNLYGSYKLGFSIPLDWSNWKYTFGCYFYSSTSDLFFNRYSSGSDIFDIFCIELNRGQRLFDKHRQRWSKNKRNYYVIVWVRRVLDWIFTKLRLQKRSIYKETVSYFEHMVPSPSVCAP